MKWLTWILAGTTIGWGTGKALKGAGYGPFMGALMGLGGGLVGGILSSHARLSGFGGAAIRTIGAVASATLVALLAARGNGRRLAVSPL